MFRGRSISTPYVPIETSPLCISVITVTRV